MGILLITHKESTSKIADKIYVVENGQTNEISQTYKMN